MSIALDATAEARAEAAVSAAQWLIQADFDSGVQFWTTWPLTVTIEGNQYSGVGNVLDVSILRESEDSSAEKATINLNVVNSALLAAAIADPTQYRDRSIRLYVQFFDQTYQPVGSKVHRWTGRMDKVAVIREPSPRGGGNSTGRIELQCTRAGMSRARNYQGLRLTDQQQQTRFPGDLVLDRMNKLIETPTPWLSRRFQEI